MPSLRELTEIPTNKTEVVSVSLFSMGVYTLELLAWLSKFEGKVAFKSA